MAGRQRVIDEDQKLELLQRMEAGETVSKLADEVGISRQRLYEWRDHLRLRGNLKSRRRGRPARVAGGVDGDVPLQSAVDPPARREKALIKARRRIRELEQKVGQQQLDLDFFAKPCGTSRKIIVGAALLAKPDLQSHRKDDDRPVARRIQHRPNVLARGRQPRELLPSLAIGYASQSNPCDRSSRDGDHRSPARAREPRASFRSRRSIRVRSLLRTSASSRHPGEHEPCRKSLCLSLRVHHIPVRDLMEPLSANYRNPHALH
ncbi:hypothetical protein CO676_24235 [Sinorhizobium sp. BJ1]|nr:hypothetical protein CO676_24235 [Sinorhizobium sp. BJ1]